MLRETPVVRGDELTSAQPSFDSRTNEPIIDFGFNNSGARKFGKLHPGPRRQAVRHRARRQGDLRPGDPRADPGRARPDQRQLHAGDRRPSSPSSCRSGALPAKLTIVEERTVGPSLGSDFIEAGKLAGIIGGIATIVLTILVYGTFGIFACVGLIVHGMLTVALMT